MKMRRSACGLRVTTIWKCVHAKKLQRDTLVMCHFRRNYVRGAETGNGMIMSNLL